jgi:hypothetical protein
MGFSLFTTGSRPVLGPTLPPTELSGQSVKLPTLLYLVLRLRMLEAIPPLPNTSSWRGALLSTGKTLLYSIATAKLAASSISSLLYNKYHTTIKIFILT